MSKYKDIKINRKGIDDLLKQNEYSVTPTSVNKTSQRNITVNDNKDNEFTLEIYMNKTGTSTLVPRNDKSNISESVCNLIKEKLAFFDIESVNVMHHVQEEDFNKLLEKICKEFVDELSEPIDISGGIQYRLASKREGNITFKYYYKKKNLQLQGKALKHFSFIYKQLIDLGYNINKSIDVIKDLNVANQTDLLDEYLPTVGKKLSADVQSIATSSLQLMKINANFSDGSIVLYPMIRTMEHVMRSILEAHSTPYCSKRGFYMFGTEVDGKTWTFNETCESMNSDCRKKLSSCYTFYHKQRHGLFHLSEDLTEARTIQTEEAKELTFDCINLIEDIGNEFY